MTWIDFMKVYDPAIDRESSEFILWNMTAYPFSDIKTTTYQIRSAIRINLNNITTCELCGYKHPYHSHGCLAKI